MDRYQSNKPTNVLLEGGTSTSKHNPETLVSAYMRCGKVVLKFVLEMHHLLVGLEGDIAQVARMVHGGWSA